jgi:hypothetical protein
MSPQNEDGVLEPPSIDLGGNDMPADPSNMDIALTSMANGASAASTRRTDRADQLAGDSDRMWTVAMTTPTQFAALAHRTVAEAGSSRTRAETNNPSNTAAPGG